MLVVLVVLREPRSSVLLHDDNSPFHISHTTLWRLTSAAAVACENSVRAVCEITQFRFSNKAQGIIHRIHSESRRGIRQDWSAL